LGCDREFDPWSARYFGCESDFGSGLEDCLDGGVECCGEQASVGIAVNVISIARVAVMVRMRFIIRVSKLLSGCLPVNMC
jgi:hypothetical protein